MNPLKLLAFALLHDWGRDAYLQDDALIITEHDGTRLSFHDMTALRDWAGY